MSLSFSDSRRTCADTRSRRGQDLWVFWGPESGPRLLVASGSVRVIRLGATYRKTLRDSFAVIDKSPGAVLVRSMRGVQTFAQFHAVAAANLHGGRP